LKFVPQKICCFVNIHMKSEGGDMLLSPR